MRIEQVTWDRVIDLCYEMANTLRWFSDDKHAIVGVAKGGLIPATLIANRLKATEVYSVGVHRYKGNEPIDPVIYGQLPLTKKELIIIDDICDSGESFTALFNLLADQGLKIKSTVAMVHKHHGTFNPSIYGMDGMEGSWYQFPWEIEALVPQGR